MARPIGEEIRARRGGTSNASAYPIEHLNRSGAAHRTMRMNLEPPMMEEEAKRSVLRIGGRLCWM